MDDVTQFLLDNYMCTEKCPCRDFNETHPSKEYAWLPETTLNLHNRTYEGRPNYLPFTWVNDTHKIGFGSFQECYNYWEDLADQGMVDLQDVFDTSDIILFGKGDFFKGPDRSDLYRKGRAPNKRLGRDPSGMYLMYHMEDMEVYQIFEDDFNCSGWCRQGIFYYQNPMAYGPPKDTCFKHLKEELATTSKPFAVTAIITGVVCLILFISHFALYFRPLKEWQPEPVAKQNHQSRPHAELVPNTSTTQVTQVDINQIEISEMGTNNAYDKPSDYIQNMDELDPYGNHLQEAPSSKRRKPSK